MLALTLLTSSCLAAIGHPRIYNDDISDRVEFQTFTLEGEVQDTLWCGPRMEHLLVLTSVGDVWKSPDRGSSFHNLKDLPN